MDSVPSKRRITVPALLAAFGVLVALELSGRVLGLPTVTPIGFVRAAWSVATGSQPSAGIADLEEVEAEMAYRPLPYLNFGLKPNWTRRGAREGGPRKTSNSLGFRGREIQIPKPAGRYRIVCLGGSTTYDDAVGDEETYPHKLEGFLREARPEMDLEVVNAAVPSYTSAESLANLAFRVLDLQPDAILLYEGINDWRPRTYPDFDGAYFHFRRVWSATPGADGLAAADGGVSINSFVERPDPGHGASRAENARRNGSEAFRRNLVSMAGMAHAHGVKVVMLSNAVNEKAPGLLPEFLEGMREHNRVVREVCAAHGALFVDLDAVYPKGDSVPPGGLFMDLVHNNPRGAELKARLVADALLANLLE